MPRDLYAPTSTPHVPRLPLTPWIRISLVYLLEWLHRKVGDDRRYLITLIRTSPTCDSGFSFDLKTDVMLLVDVFENFLRQLHRELWARPRVLHLTRLQVGLWIHTYRCKIWTHRYRHVNVYRAISAVMNQCSNRIRESTTNICRRSSKPSLYLMYYDVDNLYGWAMCQLLR